MSLWKQFYYLLVIYSLMVVFWNEIHLYHFSIVGGIERPHIWIGNIGYHCSRIIFPIGIACGFCQRDIMNDPL